MLGVQQWAEVRRLVLVEGLSRVQKRGKPAIPTLNCANAPARAEIKLRSTRPRRRRNQTQSHRERLRAAHPTRDARLDLRPVPDRLARLARTLTPTRPRYADKIPTGSVLTSPNDPAGRITQPSA